MEEKITVTRRFDKEVIEHSDQNVQISSFAEWCSQKYREEFMDLESKKLQIRKLEEQIEQLNKECEILQKEEIVPDFLSPDDLYWLKNTGLQIAMNYTEEGAFQRFRRERNRLDINRKQFKKILVQIQQDGN